MNMEAKGPVVKVDYHVGDSPEEVFSLLEGWGEGEIAQARDAFLLELLFVSMVRSFFGVLLVWFAFPVAVSIGALSVVWCMLVYLLKVKRVVFSSVSPVRGERELEFRDDKLCIRKGESIDWWIWKYVTVEEVTQDVLLLNVIDVEKFILYRGKSVAEDEFDRVRDFLKERGLVRGYDPEWVVKEPYTGVLYRSVLLHFVGVLGLYLLVYDYWKHGG